MKLLINILRLATASLFIISGLVKLNDPIGFSYKLEEYFSPDVFNLEFLVPYALFIALALSLFEVVLGVLLFIGYKSATTIKSLLLLIVFFSFLTFYSAYFNKVTDCGCFGDAVKLTPWQSFAKNIALLAALFILFSQKRHIIALAGKKMLRLLTFVSIVICIGISYYSLRHLPVIDFRPYATGKNIPEGMEIPEGAPKAVYDDTWIYRIDGKDKKFKTDEHPWDIQGATFVGRETRLIKKGYTSPIHDFSMETEGVDSTKELMQKEKLVLFILYNISKANTKSYAVLKELTTKARKKGYVVYGLTASGEGLVIRMKKKYDLNFDFLFCDETCLKTIIRSNPGIMILNKGTIKGKWHWKDAENIRF